MTRFIVALVLVVLVTPGCAGRIGPSGLEGHSIERFPLTVLIDRLDDDVERAVYRAVEDWNTVVRETRELGRALGLPHVDSAQSARRQLAEHYRVFWGTQPC